MTDLTDVISDLNSRRKDITKYRNYYDGNQPITFVGSNLVTTFGEKLKGLNANRCAAVVDLIADRLQITGFADANGDDAQASEFWSANDLDQLANEIHQEALTTGDAFVIVLPDRDGSPALHTQRSERIAVIYDDETQRTIRVAAKVWRLRDSTWRLNLFYSDRLEKYITVKPEPDELPTHPERWQRHQDEDDQSWPISLPWSRVPVFHLANNARSGEYGTSEIAAIIPLQDRLNLTLANQTIAEETQSFRQRWATGLQPIKDEQTGDLIVPFKSGAGEVWVATNPDVTFGEFDAADLTMFETVAEGHELRIARTSRTPLHYLLQSGNPPSGEALKTAEAPFVAKIIDRQRSFGVVWSQIMQFVLELQGSPRTNLKTQWTDPSTRSESDFWKNSIFKHERGVSDRQILSEAGYSPAQIDRFADEQMVSVDALGLRNVA